MLDPRVLQQASGSLRSVEQQKQETPVEEEEEDGRSDLLEAIRKGKKNYLYSWICAGSKIWSDHTEGRRAPRYKLVKHFCEDRFKVSSIAEVLQ